MHFISYYDIYDIIDNVFKAHIYNLKFNKLR
jgi:hypothetical protein